MKISKDRTYTTRDGRAVRIYATDGSDEYPTHGAVKRANGWVEDSWNNGNNNGITTSFDLIEALKPNGIPVDLPDPPEVEGYTWELRGWEWNNNGVEVPFASLSLIGKPYWVEFADGCLDPSGATGHFYIEYIPIPAVEMTLAEDCAELGKTIKIIK